MTIKQNLKRFFATSVLISVGTTLTTVVVFYSLYVSKNLEYSVGLNNIKSQYNNLVAQEKSAQNFLDKIENSSDEKKRNVIRVVSLESEINPIIAKVSESNPYFDFSLNKINLDSQYVNVARIVVDLKLKDDELGDEFYAIYGKILEEAFLRIKSNNLRELIKINDKQYEIVYKKEYV